MSLRLCKYSTMRLLWVGSTRAKQRTVRQACRCRCGGSSSNSRPVRPLPYASPSPSSSSCSVMMPTRRQIDKAVPLLSPINPQEDQVRFRNLKCIQYLSINRKGLNLDEILKFHQVWRTCDHNDPYAGLSAHAHCAQHFLPRWIQHSHTTNKGQVRLRKKHVQVILYHLHILMDDFKLCLHKISIWVTSYSVKAAEFSKFRVRGSGGESLVAMARHRRVSRPEPHSRTVLKSCSLRSEVSGTRVPPPTRIQRQRSSTLSGAPWVIKWTTTVSLHFINRMLNVILLYILFENICYILYLNYFYIIFKLFEWSKLKIKKMEARPWQTSWPLKQSEWVCLDCRKQTWTSYPEKIPKSALFSLTALWPERERNTFQMSFSIFVFFCFPVQISKNC